MIRIVVITSLITVYLLSAVVCPPVTQPPAKPEEDDNEQSENMGLEYGRYLKEVVGVLESDESFRKKLEESNISEIQTGEIAQHLDFVGHGIRTKLDELKRKELDRLRQVMRLKSYLQKSLKESHPNIELPEVDRERVLGHLDHNNPNSFEVADLAKLIQKASKDLGDIDKKRKEEFKNYEMEKELLRRQQLEALNETARLEEEKKFEEMQKKHDDHPKLHHPGNEEQLKEVWEESDGLSKKDFEPKTFFHLHDTNGDGFLDAGEVEALFQKELDKVYDPNAPEDDMLERYEEMNRMREHFVNEVDRDKDSMISMEEFIDNTRKEEFKNDEEWQPLESEDTFNEEELVAFEKNYDNVQKQKELERERLDKIRMNLERLGHPTPIPRKDRQNEHDGRQEIPQGGEKGDGQQQQHVQQVVAHQQPLVHGQQNGQQNGQQPVQHMQQREEQPEEHRLQHHEQPVVHEQPIVQQPVVQEQPNVQEPVPAEQHFQQPVAADEQHVQQPVAIEQHVQQPVGVQEGGVAVDNAQAHQQPLVEQPPHQEGLQDPGAL